MSKKTKRLYRLVPNMTSIKRAEAKEEAGMAEGVPAEVETVPETLATGVMEGAGLGTVGGVVAEAVTSGVLAVLREGVVVKVVVAKAEVGTEVEETEVVMGAVMGEAAKAAESVGGREGKVELEATEAEWEMVEEMAAGLEVVEREEAELEEEDWEAVMAEVELEEEGEVPSLAGMEAEKVETTAVAETVVADLDWVY